MRNEVSSDAYRVLLIDDDVDFAEYTRTILERRAGCRVVVLNDPADARAVALEFLPDVVVTDVVMPGMTGLELLNQLRIDRPGIPVIVMTGHHSLHQNGQDVRSLASEFYLKPVDSGALISSVLDSARAWRGEQPVAELSGELPRISGEYSAF